MTVTVPGNVRLTRHIGDLDDDGHDINASTTHLQVLIDGTGSVVFAGTGDPIEVEVA